MAILNRFFRDSTLLRFDSILCFSLRNFWRFLPRFSGELRFVIRDPLALFFARVVFWTNGSLVNKLAFPIEVLKSLGRFPAERPECENVLLKIILGLSVCDVGVSQDLEL